MEVTKWKKILPSSYFEVLFHWWLWCSQHCSNPIKRQVVLLWYQLLFVVEAHMCSRERAQVMLPVMCYLDVCFVSGSSLYVIILFSIVRITQKFSILVDGPSSVDVLSYKQINFFDGLTLVSPILMNTRDFTSIKCCCTWFLQYLPC